MTETTVGAPTNYGTYPNATTDEEPYSIAFDRFVFRADTQQELDDLLAWLSNVAGKPVDELDDGDILRFVKLSDLSNCISTRGPDGGRSIKSFALKQSNTDLVNEFNRTEFFGDTIPEFSAGTGTFIGAPIDLSVGVGTHATAAGFAGTAQTLFTTNYPDGSSVTLLSQTQLDQLNPEVRGLMENMFGAGTPLALEHMNVLKMMNLISGKATESVSTWTITPTQGQVLLEAFGSQEGSSTFINAISLLNLRSTDIALAEGARNYFDEAGNFIQGFGTGNVEQVASELVDTMSPPDTPMPSNITLGDRVSVMLNNLLGLDPANTTFTVEQVNAALAMGLLSYDANGAVSLTPKGQGYLTTKEAENAEPVITPQTTVVQPLTPDEKVDAFLSSLLNMPGYGNVFEIFDEGRDGRGSDGKISDEDINSLANKNPYDNNHWRRDFAGIPIDKRVAIVALAQYAQRHGIIGHLQSNHGEGQRYQGVFDGRWIRGSGNGGAIDSYVAGLSGDRPTLSFTAVGNGFTNTAQVVEMRGDKAVNS